MAKTKISSVRRYSVRAAWLDGELEEFFSNFVMPKSALFRGKSISFDWKFDGDLETVQLTSTDGIEYRGTSVLFNGTNRERTRRISGTLYSNAKGHLLLADCIDPNGDAETWFVQFHDGTDVK